MMYGRASYELLKRRVLLRSHELFLKNNKILVTPTYIFSPKLRKDHFNLAITL